MLYIEHLFEPVNPQGRPGMRIPSMHCERGTVTCRCHDRAEGRENGHYVSGSAHLLGESGGEWMLPQKCARVTRARPYGTNDIVKTGRVCPEKGMLGLFVFW